MSQLKMADNEDDMFLNSLQMATVLFMLCNNLTEYVICWFQMPSVKV